MRQRFWPGLSAATLLLVSVACGNYQENSNPSNQLQGESLNTLSYATVRALVLAPNCFSCHSAAGGNQDNLNFETYQNTFPNVADIQSEVSSNDMPLTGPNVPDNEKAILFAWIAAGAPETSDLPLPSPSPTPTPSPSPSPTPLPTPTPTPSPSPSPSPSSASVIRKHK